MGYNIPMKSQKGSALIWTVIIIAILVIACGIYFYSQPKQSAMVGWQTYTNTQDGFSIKYPNNYFVIQSDNGLNEIANYSLSDLRAYQQSHAGENPPDFGDITVGVVSSDMSLEQYIDSNESNDEKYTSSTSTILVGDGISGLREIFENSDRPFVFVKQGRNIYVISSDIVNGKVLPIYQDMLTTFKFISTKN